MPLSANLVRCKWIYKIKTKSDGFIERYKAHLVTWGLTQEYGIDYKEIFSPVTKMTPIRTLLDLAVTRQWPLYQMDVKNAFLNGDLSEVVYMQSPPGVTALTGHVYRLQWAFYGLK